MNIFFITEISSYYVTQMRNVLFGYHRWKMDCKRFDQLPVYGGYSDLKTEKERER